MKILFKNVLILFIFRAHTHYLRQSYLSQHLNSCVCVNFSFQETLKQINELYKVLHSGIIDMNNINEQPVYKLKSRDLCYQATFQQRLLSLHVSVL